MKNKIQAELILPDIRSAQNVGAIFRTADAVGISKIYLVGITPLPVDKFMRARPDIAKTALGAEKSIPWEHEDDLVPLLKKKKKEGFLVVAIEQSSKSSDYKKIKPSDKTIFVLGPEVEGLSENILKLCDFIAEIPMRGEKESLNVSVAAGIVLYRALDK